MLFRSLKINKNEQELMLRGLIYGIISSYFIIQGSAFVFRPYDIVRYMGSYNNPNMNALFYVVVFAAFLANHFFIIDKKSKSIYRITNYVFMMSVFGFTILSMGKAAFLSEIFLMFLYLFVMCKKTNEKVRFVFSQTIVWICVTLALTPLCFISARYLPPLFHHSVWFYGEYSTERVHSFDAYDSEKYPEVVEVVNELLDRYLGIGIIPTTKPKTELLERNQNIKSKAVAGDGADEMHPLYIEGEASNTYSARIGIWKEYYKRLNLTGHKIEEPHFWLTENYYILHAHNLFLEFAYNFGVVIGFFFFLGYTIFAIKQILHTYKKRNFKNFSILIMFLILGLFGMFELDFYVGQAPLTLFFFMLVNMIWNNEKDKKSIEEGEKKCEKIYS